jgi:putative DNA primase/helicase
MGWGRITNVAIACGKSGLVVIDIDPRHGGSESFRALVRKLGDPGPAMKVTTGGGGLHLYYKAPEGGIRSKVGLAPGVDLRGVGAYVVAPPSMHVCGSIYKWHPNHDLATWSPQLHPLPPNWTDQMGEAPKRAVAPDPNKYVEGERNATLASIAGSMRSRGAHQGAILESLRAINKRMCVPPLEEEEVDSIAHSISRYPPQALGTKTETMKDLDFEIRETGAFIDKVKNGTEALPPMTDAGNAAWMLTVYGRTMRFNPDTGRWLTFRDGTWRLSDTPEQTPMTRAIRAVRLRGLLFPDLAEDKSLAMLERSWALKSESFNRLSALLTISQSMSAFRAPSAMWDTCPYYIGTPRGVVDLRDGSPLPSQPDLLISRRVACDFDPEAKAPKWTQFLQAIFCNKLPLLDFVWRAAGYSTTGFTHEQVLFVLMGAGANGKSTFLAMLRKVLGDYAWESTMGVLCSDSPGDIPNDLAALEGRHFVTCSEADTKRLSEARVKALTGSDAVTARFLHQEFFSFLPRAKIWLATNEGRIPIGSSAFWRRIRFIPFMATFTNDPGAVGGVPSGLLDMAQHAGSSSPIPPPTVLPRNTRIAEELEAELPGILAWCVFGAADWFRNGLPKGTAVDAATDAMMETSDPLDEFTKTCIVPDIEATTAMKDVFQEYIRWADAENVPLKERLGRITLAKSLMRRFVRFRTRQGYVFRGFFVRQIA